MEPVPPPFEIGLCRRTHLASRLQQRGRLRGARPHESRPRGSTTSTSYDAGVAAPVHYRSRRSSIRRPHPLRIRRISRPGSLRLCRFVHGYVEHLKRAVPGTDRREHLPGRLSAYRPFPGNIVELVLQPRAASTTTKSRGTNLVPCVDGPAGSAALEDSPAQPAHARGSTCPPTARGCGPTNSVLRLSGARASRFGSARMQCSDTFQPVGVPEHVRRSRFRPDAGNAVAREHFTQALPLPEVQAQPRACSDGLYRPLQLKVRPDSTPRRRTSATTPPRSGGTVLWSGQLTDGGELASNVLDFSGDLLCRGPFGTTVCAPDVSASHHADRVARGEFFASTAARSSDLFDACLTRAP